MNSQFLTYGPTVRSLSPHVLNFSIVAPMFSFLPACFHLLCGESIIVKAALFLNQTSVWHSCTVMGVYNINHSVAAFDFTKQLPNVCFRKHFLWGFFFNAHVINSLLFHVMLLTVLGACLCHTFCLRERLSCHYNASDFPL